MVDGSRGDPVGDAADVPELIVDLVDRSLVHRVAAGGRSRFHLLQTIRAFAAERLVTAGSHHGTVERFVPDHVDLAERIDVGLRGSDERMWAEVLEAQLTNLEAAYDQAWQLGDIDAVVRIAVAPYVFVYQRSRADVGAWAEVALPPAQEVGHPLTPAAAALVALNRQLTAGSPR